MNIAYTQRDADVCLYKDLTEDKNDPNYDVHSILMDMMSSLNEEGRQVINKVYYEGLTKSEAARSLGISRDELSSKLIGALIKMSKPKELWRLRNGWYPTYRDISPEMDLTEYYDDLFITAATRSVGINTFADLCARSVDDCLATMSEKVVSTLANDLLRVGMWFDSSRRGVGSRLSAPYDRIFNDIVSKNKLDHVTEYPDNLSVRMEHALARLNNKDLMIVYGFYHEQRPKCVLADEFGMSEKAIRSSLNRSIQRLGRPDVMYYLMNGEEYSWKNMRLTADIYYLGLSDTINRVLINAGYPYISQLVRKSYKQLIKINGIGKRSADQIRGSLNNMGLKLLEDEEVPR